MNIKYYKVSNLQPSKGMDVCSMLATFQIMIKIESYIFKIDWIIRNTLKVIPIKENEYSFLIPHNKIFEFREGIYVLNISNFLDKTIQYGDKFSTKMEVIERIKLNLYPTEIFNFSYYGKNYSCFTSNNEKIEISAYITMIESQLRINCC